MRHTRFRRWTLVLVIVLLLRMWTPSCFADVKVYRSVPTGDKRIALTFDDGPHPSLTPRILEILDRFGIQATFFMVGQNIIYYPEAAKMVIERGHEVGNHTFTHPYIAG